MAVTTRESSATRPEDRKRHEALGLSLDDVKGMYRYMLMTRLVSERILQLNRMGRTPFGAGTDGHEAAQVGAAWCIQKGKDWTVPYYRDMAVAFVLGFSALDQFRSVLAKATDPNSGGRAVLNMFSVPKDRILSRSVCVGTEFPHAVGLALALRLRKEPQIVFAFGGDASTSPGDFHEAANFASVHKLPVVFVIENNLLAISTRFESQTAVKDIAEKAAAYAMPGFVADGMDVLDSYEKTRLGAEHARAGKGPALVELRCYRYQPHTSDDDDTRYRTKQEVEEWKARDPLKLGREYLLAAGVSSEALESIRAELADEIERAIAQAESEPEPRPEDATTHVYAEGTPLPDGTRA
jgi:2-oxoisovalerate dehydrogenase E1 component alpha subunit